MDKTTVSPTHLSLEEMNRIKNERGYSMARLSDLSGVPLGTLRKILSGETQNPREATLLAIEKVLTGDERVYCGRAYRIMHDSILTDPALKDPVLAETIWEYGISSSEKKYTVKDYYALPDDQRVELIDGVFYDMASPNYIHQRLSFILGTQINDHIRKNNGRCEVLLAPTDVQLDCDDRTMVQPDVMVVCDHNRFRDFGLYGAPDLAIEVLSPSTRNKDMMIKTQKYQAAGVKEYWIIDPKKKVLIRYDFTDKDYIPEVVSLTGSKAINIFEAPLLIDLDELRTAIESAPSN